MVLKIASPYIIEQRRRIGGSTIETDRPPYGHFAYMVDNVV
jgi:hypothetical protein